MPLTAIPVEIYGKLIFNHKCIDMDMKHWWYKSETAWSSYLLDWHTTKVRKLNNITVAQEAPLK